jgi:hypothetical protein
VAQTELRSRGHTARRALVGSMRPAPGQTRAPSPRPLPTDHDHDGELRARSANIRVINRRQRALGFGFAWAISPSRRPDFRKPLDRSFHIRTRRPRAVARPCGPMGCYRTRLLAPASGAFRSCPSSSAHAGPGMTAHSKALSAVATRARMSPRAAVTIARATQQHDLEVVPLPIEGSGDDARCSRVVQSDDPPLPAGHDHRDRCIASQALRALLRLIDAVPQ